MNQVTGYSYNRVKSILQREEHILPYLYPFLYLSFFIFMIF